MNRGKFEPRPCTSFSESKFRFWALTLIQSVPGTKSFSKPEAFRFGRVCLGGRHSCRLLVFSPNRLYTVDFVKTQALLSQLFDIYLDKNNILDIRYSEVKLISVGVNDPSDLGMLRI